MNKKKPSVKHRIAVHRSNLHIYAQIINDEKGMTIASASDHELTAKKTTKKTNRIDTAQHVGELLAEKAKKANVTHVYFDRRGFRYHGRVKALAEGARKGGLTF